MDARDLGTITIGGPTLGVAAYIGPLHLGLLSEGSGAHSFGPAEEFGLKHGEWGESHSTYNAITLYYEEFSRSGGVYSNPTPSSMRAVERAKNIPNHGLEYARVGGTGGLCIGLRIDLNIIELADFLLGLFGIDLVGDDIYGEKRPANSSSAPPQAPNPD